MLNDDTVPPVTVAIFMSPAPLHAHEGEIAKSKGRFDAGWPQFGAAQCDFVPMDEEFPGGMN